MPRGSNFLLLRQKKVTKEKATPTFAVIRDLFGAITAKYRIRLARVRERMPAGQVRVLVVRAERKKFVLGLSNQKASFTIALMPRGSNFLLLRQKKVTKEKATPTFALIQNLERKCGAVGNSLSLKQPTASSTFSLQILGSNERGPSS